MLSVYILSAVISAAVAFFVALLTHQREILFKRKELVSSACQTALARVEMVYRIQRRSEDKNHKEQDSINIRDKFHKIQEDTVFYESMLFLESKRLKKAYCRFIEKIKEELGMEMVSAWDGSGGIQKRIKPLSMQIIEKEKHIFLLEAEIFTSGFFRKPFLLLKYYCRKW